MADDIPDVLIVGAGPAGSGLAYLLASQGHAVLLVDKAAFPRDKTCGDGLSPRALRVLRAMGLLPQVLRAGCQVRRIMLFAPNGRPLESAVPVVGDQPDFAAVLPRTILDNLLRAHAASAGAEFRAGVTATDLLRAGEAVAGVRASTPAGPAELRARVTVLATGASTAVLERAGLLPAPPAFGRAARTYFENVQGLSGAVEFHFDSVPLPGYGWVFPTSATSANVGAGYFVRAGQRPPRASPRQAFDDFVANPYVAGVLRGARATAPVKGYPLRFDFPTVRLAYPGLLLVGEAAGLVNPLTGEGIDYALESAEVAGQVVSQALRAGRPAAELAQRYAQAARARFLRAFENTLRMREVYLRPWVMNRCVAAANRSETLKELLLNVALGNIDPARALTPRVLLRVARG